MSEMLEELVEAAARAIIYQRLLHTEGAEQLARIGLTQDTLRLLEPDRIEARAALAVIVPMVEAAELDRCVGIIAMYKAQFLAGDPEKLLFNAGYIKGTEQTCENIAAAIRKDAREMMEKPESWYCEQCAITDLRHTIKCFEDDADDELGCCESCGQTFKDEDDSLSMGEVYFCRKCAAEWKAEYDACQHEWGEPDPHWGDQRICNKCGGYEPEMPALTEQEKAPPGGR